jgi:hypothetical protein
VCTFEPLSQGQSHPLSDRVIVALATISKVIVLTIRPAMKVIFTHPLIGSKSTLPILSWQFVIIQTSKANKVVDPVLAFGRQSTIYFYQVNQNSLQIIFLIPIPFISYLPLKNFNFTSNSLLNYIKGYVQH